MVIRFDSSVVFEPRVVVLASFYALKLLDLDLLG